MVIETQRGIEAELSITASHSRPSSALKVVVAVADQLLDAFEVVVEEGRLGPATGEDRDFVAPVERVLDLVRADEGRAAQDEDALRTGQGVTGEGAEGAQHAEGAAGAGGGLDEVASGWLGMMRVRSSSVARCPAAAQSYLRRVRPATVAMSQRWRE